MSSLRNESVGLIGVGLLGSAIAARLLEENAHVLAFDVNAQQIANSELRCDRFEAKESTQMIFSQCERVVLSLPNSSIVEDTLYKHKINANTLIIDTTTGDPASSEALGKKLLQIQVHYLDSTIVGSSAQVRNSDVISLVGGDKDAFQRARPILDSFCRQTFYLGNSGSGAKMKLVANLAIGLNRAVLAEALSLANVFELDLSTVLDVLKSSAAYSRVMDTKGPKMITEDFHPQARLSQHLKDVRLMLASAKRADHNLPLSSLHEQLLQSLVDAGFADLDNSAIFKAFGVDSK